MEWNRVKRNKGAAGNNGETIEAIVERGEVEYLKSFRENYARNDTDSIHKAVLAGMYWDGSY